MQLAKYAIFQARLHEEDPALGFTGGVVTYGLLAKGVEASVNQLQKLDLAKDALVVLYVSNPFHQVSLYLALQLLGHPTASIFAPAQVQYSGLTPAAIVTDRADFDMPGSRVVRLTEQWFIVDPVAPANYERLLALPGFASPDDVAQVSFSSGTTGYPKAIATTAGTVEKATFEGAMLHAGPHSHAVRCLAMTGVSGSSGLVMYVLAQGGFMALATQPDEVLRLIRAFDLEALFGAVGQLQSLLPALGKNLPPRSLRTVVAFGSRIPKPLLTELRTRLCANFNVMYSSTEASLMAFATGTLLDRYDGSVGYVLPGIRIEIVDADHQPLAAGQEGIIRVRTPFQNHYIMSTPETEAMFRDGWFYPGDVGTLHADGILAITGRASEVINRGGVIVAPEMIEDALRNYPGVKDVAVFGVPGKNGLDQIWAAIVSDNWVDEHAIRTVLSARLPDRTPDRVVQVDEIPRTNTSKVKRAELRQRFSS